jgi:2-aminoadipate transaminase
MTPTIELSQAARRTKEPPISDLMQRALATPNLISLAAGFVDQATLPTAPTLSAASAMLRDPVEGHRSLQYGTTRGDFLFRQRLIALLEQDEGVAPGSFERIIPRTIVTTGSQQLLYLICEALLDPGDVVLVEAPTYFVFLGLLETRGARVIGIATDSGGLCLDSLERTLADLEHRGELDRVKLIYTISEHSNPTGLSLDEDRRGPLVEIARRWSKRRRIFILEDAAYRGLNLDGCDPPSVWTHDTAGDSVILARTFSKTFSPGLKTGFGVLPEALLSPILNLKGNHDFGTCHFTQQLLDGILAQGTYRPHLSRLVSTYRHKRDVILSALDRHLGGKPGISWTRPRGGIYVWLTLPEGVETGRDSRLFRACLEHGVLYVPGEYAYAPEPGPVPSNRIRLCYGVPGDAELIEGVRRLSVALSECLGPMA